MGSIEAFIREHREDDVRQLALQGKRYPDVDMPFALEQIAGWQTARKKIPSWAAIDGIVYPPHLSMEQCSSEQTARYKAGIVSRCGGTEVRGYEKCDEAHDGILVPSHPRTPAPPKKIVDLTGGLGVDFAFLARAMAPAQGSVRCGSAAATATYVERQPNLCEAARHNFQLLGLHHAEVVCADAIDYLHQLDQAYLIFLDPARRDTKGSRTYAISDCTPDVLAMEEELLEKAEWVMVKLSPMLDWHKAVSDLNRLGDVVREVHIVSVGNECKELLLLLSKQATAPLTVFCVNNDVSFCYVPSAADEKFTKVHQIGDSYPFYRNQQDGGNPKKCTNTQNTLFTPFYLFEPNSSVMKAGCFDLLQKRFNATILGSNSHLFVSDSFIEDFPGRKFQVLAVSSVNKNAAKMGRFATGRANVSVRNFPMTAEALRKKLKLKDGGETYIFGTTLDDRNLAEDWGVKTGPILLIAKKN